MSTTSIRSLIDEKYEMDANVSFLLKDTRYCNSPNLQQFFRSKEGRDMAKRLYWFKEKDGLRIIRFEGNLWFATLGWRVRLGNDTGFAGVEIARVARLGRRAKTGYPDWQKGGDYEDVTDWFWEKYKEAGIVAFPEIWGVRIPAVLKHAEAHQI